MDMQGQVSAEVILNIFGELSSTDKKYDLSFTSSFNELLKFNVKNGHLYFVPSENSKGLEIYLIGFNLLTPEQIEELIKYRDESGLPLESILQEADILTLDQTKEVWKSIVDDLVLDLFTWDGGSYQMTELSEDFDETNGSFDLGQLGDYEEQIHERLGLVEKLGGYQNVPSQVTDSVDAWMQENKELLTEQLFSSIDGKNNLNNILNWSYTTKGETLKLLSFFSENNLIVLSQSESSVSSETSVVEEEQQFQSNPVPPQSEPDANGYVEVNVDTPLPSTGNFSGSLSILSLIEVIQTLNAAKRSGLLVLDIEGGPANLKLVNGELVGIEFGEEVNRDAFYNLVSIHKGEFYFEATTDTYEREMNIPTMSLLMEAMRLLDEKGEGSPGNAGSDIEAFLNEDSDGEPITSARALTKKSSSAVFFIKLFVLLFLGATAAYVFLDYLPGEKKKEAFNEIKISNARAKSSSNFEEIKNNWMVFQKNNPGWYEDIEKEIDSVEANRSIAINKVLKNSKRLAKKKKFKLAFKAIEENFFLAKGSPISVKKFEKQKSSIRKEQMVKDYSNWKKTSSENFNAAEKLAFEFRNVEALNLLNPIKEHVDVVKDTELSKKLIALIDSLNKREANIKEAQKVIKSKTVTYSEKITAYKKIVLNAGEKQLRGIEALENIKNSKNNVEGFSLKVDQYLAQKKNSTITEINLGLKNLKSEASNSDEIQFVQKLIEDNLRLDKEADVIYKKYQSEIKSKNLKKAFDLAKQIIKNYSTANCSKKIKIPFLLTGNSLSVVTLNGKPVKFPYTGFVPNNLEYVAVATFKGCKTIQISVNKDIAQFEIPFKFIKEPIWSYNFKGNLKSIPKLLKVNGKQGILLANGHDLELVLIETGGRVWRKQINNPIKPYIKADGKKMVYGDDEFWNLNSQIAVFENYVAVGSKNSEIIILNGEDGSPLVSQQLGFVADSEPLFLRLPLLGNKIFVYAGTRNGELINIKVSDKRVRLRKMIGSRYNGIVSIKRFDKFHLLVVLQSEVRCYTISNLKEKWTKKLDNDASGAFVLEGSLYIQTKNGVISTKGNSKDWKFISFPSANIRSYDYSDGSYIVCTRSGDFFELSNNRFLKLDQFSNAKKIGKFGSNYYVLDEKSLKCYSGKSILWQVDVNSKDSSMVLVGNMILLSINKKLKAFRLN